MIHLVRDVSLWVHFNAAGWRRALPRWPAWRSLAPLASAPQRAGGEVRVRSRPGRVPRLGYEELALAPPRRCTLACAGGRFRRSLAASAQLGLLEPGLCSKRFVGKSHPLGVKPALPSSGSPNR